MQRIARPGVGGNVFRLQVVGFGDRLDELLLFAERRIAAAVLCHLIDGVECILAGAEWILVRTDAYGIGGHGTAVTVPSARRRLLGERKLVEEGKRGAGRDDGGNPSKTTARKSPRGEFGCVDHFRGRLLAVMGNIQAKAGARERSQCRTNAEACGAAQFARNEQACLATGRVSCDYGCAGTGKSSCKPTARPARKNPLSPALSPEGKLLRKNPRER